MLAIDLTLSVLSNRTSIETWLSGLAGLPTIARPLPAQGLSQSRDDILLGHPGGDAGISLGRGINASIRDGSLGAPGQENKRHSERGGEQSANFRHYV